MKITQIVLTKTKDGDWKFTVMSRRQTECSTVYDDVNEALDGLEQTMIREEWETLSL